IEKYSEIPELPDAKKNRFVTDFGVKAHDAGIICSTKETAQYFEDMMACGISGKMATTWLNVELQGRLSDGMTISNSPVSPQKLASLIKSIESGDISGKAGKEVLDYLMENDASVEEVIEKLGLKQVSDDGAILVIIDEILNV
ncbi:Aspartyl/glutamyl-tRNA(Asn/Gln) amidotransferase, subunit B /E like protein, partial [Aduncisulcus paluster]